MNASDLRAQTADQLGEQLVRLKKEHFNLRFQQATGQLENTRRIREVRRDISRIMTVQGERRRASVQSSAAGRSGS